MSIHVPRSWQWSQSILHHQKHWSIRNQKRQQPRRSALLPWLRIEACFCYLGARAAKVIWFSISHQLIEDACLQPLESGNVEEHLPIPGHVDRVLIFSREALELMPKRIFIRRHDQIVLDLKRYAPLTCSPGRLSKNLWDWWSACWLELSWAGVVPSGQMAPQPRFTHEPQGIALSQRNFRL